MIEPVSLPSAAAIDYGQGDVRHLAQGDALDVPSLSNPTRELANRDNLLANTLNEVVEAVNNQEQLVPLPVVRTMLAPSDQVLVCNYRIPAGFEARVLNAIVAATPATTDVELDILYNSSNYGGSAGTAVATVTPGSEFNSGTTFYPQGEFILSLKNNGALTLEASASVMLTMRPLGAVGSLLIGTVVAGPPGLPGMTGGIGPAGPPGSGGAGTPGMIWTGTWNYTTPYSTNMVASYVESTGALSSFICLVGNTNTPPEGSALWDYVAQGGVQGQIGPAGPSGVVPNYLTGIVYGTLTTGADWHNTPINGYYNNVLTAGTSVPVPLWESYINSATANPGYLRSLNILTGRLQIAFRGHGTVTLPTQAYGAQMDYDNNTTTLMVSAQGTLPDYTTATVTSTGSFYTSGSVASNGSVTITSAAVASTGNFSISGSVATVSVVPTGLNGFTLYNSNPSDLWTQIAVLGVNTN